MTADKSGLLCSELLHQSNTDWSTSSTRIKRCITFTNTYTSILLWNFQKDEQKQSSLTTKRHLCTKLLCFSRKIFFESEEFEHFPPSASFSFYFSLYLIHLSPKVLMTNFNGPTSSHSKVFSVMKLQSSVSIDPTSFRYHQNTLCVHISCCFCYVPLFNASISCSSNKREAIREALLKQKLLFFSSRSVKFLGKKSILKGQGPIKQHVDWQACWEEEGVKGFFLAQSYHSVALKARQRSLRQTLSWHGF